MSNGITEYLRYIDLSGCIGMSAGCISLLRESSPYLTPENISCCDNLQLSLSTVNCCRNVDNNSGRYCCRCIN
jgi:hypothetical protein